MLYGNIYTYMCPKDLLISGNDATDECAVRLGDRCSAAKGTDGTPGIIAETKKRDSLPPCEAKESTGSSSSDAAQRRKRRERPERGWRSRGDGAKPRDAAERLPGSGAGFQARPRGGRRSLPSSGAPAHARVTPTRSHHHTTTPRRCRCRCRCSDSSSSLAACRACMALTPSDRRCRISRRDGRVLFRGV